MKNKFLNIQYFFFFFFKFQDVTVVSFLASLCKQWAVRPFITGHLKLTVLHQQQVISSPNENGKVGLMSVSISCL